MPLHGLLVIPALCLTLGGYIAACTDLHNHARRSLLLGSAIAIPYVIILFILNSQVNGSTIPTGDASGSTSTLGIDALTLLIYGLLWGLLFGTFGYPLPDVHIVAPTANTLRLNQNYQFSASASGRDITYEWGFGDQNMAYGANVNHSYASNGNFTVTVIVTDEAGHSSSATTDVSVFPPPPQATFTYSASSYGGYVSFDASSSSADSSTSISAYQWDFGDGTTDTTSYSQDGHYYNSTGTFQVTLTVIDATGQRSDPYAMNVSISLS